MNRLSVVLSTTFKKDYKLSCKRGMPIPLLEAVVEKLSSNQLLEAKNKDHQLAGEYASYRECHILPDWLLIYQISESTLFLVRLGTHSDLF